MVDCWLFAPFSDLPIMSIYDIAVQKLGFPAIELFVKVSRAKRHKLNQTWIVIPPPPPVAYFQTKHLKKKILQNGCCSREVPVFVLSVATTPSYCQVRRRLLTALLHRLTILAFWLRETNVNIRKSESRNTSLIGVCICHTGWQRWREHRQLSLLPKTLHDPVAQRGHLQRHHRWPEKVKTKSLHLSSHHHACGHFPHWDRLFFTCTVRKPADLQDLAPGTNPPFVTFNGEVKVDVNKIEEFLEEKLTPPRYAKYRKKFEQEIIVMKTPVTRSGTLMEAKYRGIRKLKKRLMENLYVSNFMVCQFLQTGNFSTLEIIQCCNLGKKLWVEKTVTYKVFLKCASLAAI